MDSVVFDMGNVIVFFDHQRACRQLAALARPGTTEEAVFAHLFHHPLERRYDEGRVSTAEFLDDLRQMFGMTASDEVIGRAWADIFEPNQRLAAQLPAIRQSVRRLVLASNTNALHFERVQTLLPETLGLFDQVVLSFEVGVRKPAEAFFRQVLRAAGAAGPACLYVDDRSDFVEAAESVGMRGYVYDARVEIPPDRFA